MNYERDDEFNEQYPNGIYKIAQAGSPSGNAWALLGWETEPDSDTEWSGYESRTGNIVAVMVGDDQRWSVDPDENIEQIQDDDCCAECGQIGCDWC